MSSIKKTTSVIIAAIITAGVAFSITDQMNSKDSDILEQINLNAVYLKNNEIVEISFEDTSNNTKSAILEVLGMDVTYHKEYVFNEKSGFVEIMHLGEIPKYGWSTTPIILEIQHSEFGHIGLKTEIYSPGELIPKIIVEHR